MYDPWWPQGWPIREACTGLGTGLEVTTGDDGSTASTTTGLMTCGDLVEHSGSSDSLVAARLGVSDAAIVRKLVMARGQDDGLHQAASIVTGTAMFALTALDDDDSTVRFCSRIQMKPLKVDSHRQLQNG